MTKKQFKDIIGFTIRKIYYRNKEVFIVKIKVTATGEEIKNQKEKLVKRGKNAKRKGSKYERDIAKAFQDRYGIELKRTPQSGGFSKKSEKADDFRGDITIVDTTQMLLLHIECKNQKQWSLKQWLEQAENDCPEGRTPIVIFHQYNSSKDYVCLSLEDFFNLVDKSKVVGKRVFKK